jgi:hypothetical protein
VSGVVFFESSIGIIRAVCLVLDYRQLVLLNSMVGISQMPKNEMAKAAAAMHRKLRAIAAVLVDPAATEHERANAEALKIRLEKQLRHETAPQGSWRDIMFRLGRTVEDMKVSTSPPAPKSDWTDHAFRVGKALRRGFKR